MPRMKKWYVCAVEGHTNEVIAGELSAERAHKDVLCQDGKTRDLWECEYALITKLLKNTANAQLKFTVFCRDGMYGPVRLWKFLKCQRAAIVNRGVSGEKVTFTA